MEKFLGLPPDWSEHGHEIDRLLGIVHWLMLVLFVGWTIYFVYALIRFRAGGNPKANYQGAKGQLSQTVEGGIVIVEVVLLVVFAIPIWASRVNDVPAEEDAFVVKVVGAQFQWNIHYPGADGVFGQTKPEFVSAVNPLGLDDDDEDGWDDITTINQLHLPVNQPILVHLTSRDVIHSFNLPNLRIKQDAIPGMTIPVWFKAVETGDSEIACAQLCGLGHYRMRGFITIHEPDGLEAWFAEQRELLGI